MVPVEEPLATEGVQDLKDWRTINNWGPTIPREGGTSHFGPSRLRGGRRKGLASLFKGTRGRGKLTEGGLHEGMMVVWKQEAVVSPNFHIHASWLKDSFKKFWWSHYGKTLVSLQRLQCIRNIAVSLVLYFWLMSSHLQTSMNSLCQIYCISSSKGPSKIILSYGSRITSTLYILWRRLRRSLMLLIGGQSHTHTQRKYWWFNRIVNAPPFTGLWCFPEGCSFKQWMGDNSKALMKVSTISLDPLVFNACRYIFPWFKATYHQSWFAPYVHS